MSLKTAIVRQFGKPTGIIGALAGHIMARRSSNRIRNRQTVEMMSLNPYSRVLEIGCGPGLALAQCAETVTAGRIVGLDHSSVMIRQARQRLGSVSALPRVELLVGCIEQLADWPEAFDRIYSLNVIQFIGDKSEFFRQVFALLDQSGMCFTTYQPRLDNDNPDGAYQMADDVAQLMQESGFVRIERAQIDGVLPAAICVFGFKPNE